MPLEQNSLSQWWGKDHDQNVWQARRKQAIDRAVAKCQSSQPDLKSLYQSLMEERRQIAADMAKNSDEHRRVSEDINWRDSEAWTFITREGKYRDFYDYLTKLFNEMGGLEEDSLKPDSLRIVYEDVSYSKLTRSRPPSKTEIKEDPYNYPATQAEYYRIDHPNLYRAIMERASKLYNSLQKTSDPGEKIKIIKTIIWHLDQAMPSGMGNAAICEMMLETLCKVHGIDFQPVNKHALMDLIAIFTPIPAHFSEKFMINPNIELHYDMRKFIEQNTFMVGLFNKVDGNMIAAAKKIQDMLEGKPVTLHTKELEAMKTKPLSEVLRPYKDLGVLENKLQLKLDSEKNYLNKTKAG